MGLSASQARFLQLTARRGDVEYEAQQINFQRLQLSDKLSAASSKYQDETTNRKMVFSFNTGSEIKKVDLSYSNYKNYMNQQLEGLSTSSSKYFLVSSSGNKLVVANEEERNKMIEMGTTTTELSVIQKAKVDYANALAEGTVENLDSSTIKYAKMDLTKYEHKVVEDSDGNQVEYVLERKYREDDFLIVDDLDNVANFQNAIENGIYYFAKEEPNEDGDMQLQRKGWETLEGGAITQDFDKTDDAAAEAEYQTAQDRIQAQDKKLELRLDQLETERNAIQTEMDSVQKVIEDNIDKTFKTFG